MVSDVLIDGTNQFRHAGEDPTAQALGGDVAEELLDRVESRCPRSAMSTRMGEIERVVRQSKLSS